MNSHYTVFLAIAGFVGIWVAMLVLIGKWSGWTSLARDYCCTEPFTGSRWHFQCGQLRWFCSYNNCLTVGGDARGLYMSIFPLLRVAHPSLFIPWREISVSRDKVLWIKQVKFVLGHELRIPLTVRERLAQRLQEAAGSSWPSETHSGS